MNNNAKITRDGQVYRIGTYGLPGPRFGERTETFVGTVRKLAPYEVVSGTTWLAKKGRNGKLGQHHFDTRGEAVAWLLER